MIRISLLIIIVFGLSACKEQVKDVQDVKEDVAFKYMDSLRVQSVPDSLLMDSDPSRLSYTYDFLLFGPGNGDAGKKIDRVSYDLLADNTLEGVLDSLAFSHSARNFKMQHQEAILQGENAEGWSVEARMALAMNKNNILSVQYEKTTQMGEGRSTKRILYANFRIDQGEIIQLKELIADEHYADFLKVAENTFRKQYNIQQHVSWDKTPFVMFADGFKLNNNFLIRETGLLFVFNPFDAAIVDDRSFDMIIAWKDIEHLLIENSPAQAIIGHDGK